MDNLTATFRLYGDVLRDAARVFPRSIVGLLLLLIAGPTLALAGALFLGKLGIVGGFLLALAECAVTGAYLGLVHLALEGRRTLGPRDVIDTLTVYLWDVMSVKFVFWIASLLLGRTPYFPLLLLVSAIAFSPAPELITQGRTRSFDLLADAARFMYENWPEWLVAHLPVVAAIAAWAAAFGLPVGDALMTLMPGFGPTFDFIQVGGTLSGFGALPSVLVLAAIVHAAMVTRAVLFKRLSSSSRRSRAWKSRR